MNILNLVGLKKSKIFCEAAIVCFENNYSSNDNN